MKRLFLYFSYIGTHYKGVQRLIAPGTKVIEDVETVQGIIEFGVRKLLRLKEVSLILSSRTDAGVHATLNTAHCNLGETSYYTSPEALCQGLNLFLENNQTEIRVRRIVEVPKDFHSRYNASSRTYRYRVAVLANNGIHNSTSLTRLTSALPIEELDRCQIVCQPFNPKAVFDACKVFLGTWDFQTFCGETPKSERDERREKQPGFFVKTIKRFSVSHFKNFNRIGSCDWDPSYNEVDVYEFYVEGSGFVRRQVRRMIGTLLAVGSGALKEEDIQYMLQNPSPNSWIPNIKSASAGGLFLKSVNYKDVPVLRGYIS